MKYAIYATDENNKPTEKLSPILDDIDVVQKWWFENVEGEDNKRKEGFEDKSLQIFPCGDDGIALEEVPQEEAELAQDCARRVLEEDSAAAMALSAMIASRQLYALGVMELEKILKDRKDTHEMTLEFLVQTALYKSKEFDTRDTLNSLQSGVLRWLEKVTTDNAEADAVERQKFLDEYEASRRASRIPVGITTDKAQAPELDRNVPVVLVGDAMAVNSVIDHVQTTALAARTEEAPNVFTVVRLSVFKDDPPKMDPEVRYVNLPAKMWQASTRTAKSFFELMQSAVYDNLAAAPDLLIVDDLIAASVPYTADSGNHPGTLSGEALKRIRDWCKEVGCALVAGVHTTSPQDLANYKWERVNQHSVLRPVTVSADDVGSPQLRRITIGRDAYTMDVDKDTLIHPSLIIEP